MEKLIADPQHASWLENTNRVSEIRDQSGRLLGIYYPNAKRNQQVASRSDRPREYTTVEMFEHLRSLASTNEERERLTLHIEEISKRNACDLP